MNERMIFKYRDDAGDRYGDPTLIASRFFKGCEELDSDLDDLFKLVDHDDIAVAGEAMEKLAPIVARAFDVPTFDTRTGKGLTVSELVDLLGDFFEWQEAVKKNTETPPSSSQPTQQSASETLSDSPALRAASAVGQTNAETTDPAPMADPVAVAPAARTVGPADLRPANPKVAPRKPEWMPRQPMAGNPGTSAVGPVAPVNPPVN